MGEAPAEQQDPFPWELGIYDAHCHPTDTMSTIPAITEAMRTRILTVMATRSQDQALVADVARQYGVKKRNSIASVPGADASSDCAKAPDKVIPAFGWHPWFSHQIYDDSAEDPTYNPCSSDLDAEKTRHYNAVLAPSPSAREDAGFIKHLPTPVPLSGLIATTRKHLETHPFALVGEIGLDKAFRLPGHEPPLDDDMTPGRRNGQRLSPYRVAMDHQVVIFKAQLSLAGSMGRAVSVHGVQAPQPLLSALRSTWKGHEKRVVSSRERRMLAEGVDEDFSSSDEDYEEDDDDHDTRPKTQKPKPFPPRICLHSFSASLETLKQYVDDRSIPAKVFFSFSHSVNYSTGAHEHARKKHIADDVIRACPDDRILLESDLHTAGEEMDQMLEQIYRKACAVKGWDLRDGVHRIRKNYEEFIIG